MPWIENLKNTYLNKQKSVFILHGNIDDFFEDKNDNDLELSSYLSQNVFASRDIVLEFNIGTGLKFRDETSKNEFQKLLLGYDSLKGTTYMDRLPADSGEIFRLLDRFLKIIGKEKSLALIISYAELLIPAQELSDLDLEQKKVLVTLLEWAKDKEILSRDLTVVLTTPNLNFISPKIAGNADIARIEVEFPQESDRKKAVSKFLKQFNVKTDISQIAISKLINGLNRKSIFELFLNFKDKEIDAKDLARVKKELIEKDNAQFFEFVETTRTLDDLAGQDKAKNRLRQDAELLHKGKFEALPMGYLICGPVGTGKSFLAECFAGEAGIPVVKLKNFREKWVGSTEANWEKVLSTLQNLAPVVIMIDEADAALGDREQDGDSGTGKRVFASLAQTMGDTTNRGKLLWMLLTSRPELLPVDLKRQGRAEVHIPLFYPKNLSEKQAFFKVLARKVKLQTDLTTFIQALKEDEILEIRSGADIESVLVKLKRAELISGENLTLEIFNQNIKSFRSSIDINTLNRQIEAALAEVTDQDLLE